LCCRRHAASGRCLAPCWSFSDTLPLKGTTLSSYQHCTVMSQLHCWNTFHLSSKNLTKIGSFHLHAVLTRCVNQGNQSLQGVQSFQNQTFQQPN
jgi:hypothetical protein